MRWTINCDDKFFKDVFVFESEPGANAPAVPATLSILSNIPEMDLVWFQLSRCFSPSFTVEVKYAGALQISPFSSVNSIGLTPLSRWSLESAKSATFCAAAFSLSVCIILNFNEANVVVECHWDPKSYCIRW